jgi:predicted nucleic acid-binding protein
LIVVDASIVVALILREDNVRDAPTVYDALTADSLTVPAHWPAEVANALWANRRRGRIPPHRLKTIIAEIFAFAPAVDPAPSPDRIELLVEFAETENLTVYDAIYIQLALISDASLATIDAAMRACARRFNIPLLPA